MQQHTNVASHFFMVDVRATYYLSRVFRIFICTPGFLPPNERSVCMGIDEQKAL